MLFDFQKYSQWANVHRRALLDFEGQGRNANSTIQQMCPPFRVENDPVCEFLSPPSVGSDRGQPPPDPYPFHKTPHVSRKCVAYAKKKPSVRAHRVINESHLSR